MAVLSGLKPEGVFKYFEEICGIPHGSTNTKMISDYVAGFAKERGLKFQQDDANNVIIWQEGTKGYEDHPAVLLQGHMDMVAEKAEDCTIDMEKEPIQIQVENGIISAKGTTLGGDDGIAVAYMLALLDDATIPHPPLECIFTVDEEIGMLGCAVLDMSDLKGRTMINLDSEDEGYFLVSCAGGLEATAHFPVEKEVVEENYKAVKLSLVGARGGHSGVEINKGRCNANILLGRALYLAGKAGIHYKLVALAGGLKDNAIPRSSAAIVVTSDVDAFTKKMEEVSAVFANEFVTTDPDIKLVVADATDADYTALHAKTGKSMTAATTKTVLTALMNLPNGIQRMSFDIEGLVETSLNLGILKTNAGEENGQAAEVSMTYSVRSSVLTERDELVDRITSLTEALGGSVTVVGAYPAWEYKQDSPLRDLMVDVFKEQYGKEPIIQALHAGVECGLFAGQLEGLDAVSIGPDMNDIHTYHETMSVDSVQRVWEFVLEVLKRL